jgi:hypothetical protein
MPDIADKRSGYNQYYIASDRPRRISLERIAQQGPPRGSGRVGSDKLVSVGFAGRTG